MKVTLVYFSVTLKLLLCSLTTKGMIKFIFTHLNMTSLTVQPYIVSIGVDKFDPKNITVDGFAAEWEEGA